MEFERDYGVIEMQWNIEWQWMGETSSGTSVSHSDRDRLYVLARTTDGKALSISGARVEEYGGRGPELLAKYSSRVTFDGRPETFTIKVSLARVQVHTPAMHLRAEWHLSVGFAPKTFVRTHVFDAA